VDYFDVSATAAENSGTAVEKALEGGEPTGSRAIPAGHEKTLAGR
jgi:hypothetical protein